MPDATLFPPEECQTYYSLPCSQSSTMRNCTPLDQVFAFELTTDCIESLPAALLLVTTGRIGLQLPLRAQHSEAR